MDRREFLRCTLVTAGSLTLGVGCSEDGTAAVDDVAADAGGGDVGGDVRPDADPDAGPGLDTRADAAGDAVAPPLVPGDAFFPQSIASGDPRPDSVVLWARVADGGRAGEDLAVSLELALDEAFTDRVALDGAPERALTAEAASDGCVKARVAGLTAATPYWYRFVYAKDGARYVSHVGRTRTAPAPDADVPVRFAYINCQDYGGRYYNVLRRLHQEELDFVVHLGDYIYETDGDPSFQIVNPARAVVFSDPDGALVIDAGTENEHRAARALGNYRDLYQLYRSDPVLQRVHEKWPMVIIWDDHEFANDCWGATANYYGGRADEYDVERRKNANQAWFEFMPVDYADDPDFRYDRSKDVPEDIRIYRDLVFGKHVHLVMTDLRAYRTDHLVPEEAFPGAVIYTEDALVAAVGELPDVAGAYFDVDAYAGGIYAAALKQAGIDEADVTGLLAVEYVNGVVAALNEQLPEADRVPVIDEAAQATLPRGLAWVHVGKTSRYSAVGSRYFVRNAGFDLLARLRWDETGGASEDMLGRDQEAWFLETMRNSTATWKVWGNEFCLVRRYFDLRTFPSIPAALQQIFQLQAEDWDGMPNRRDALLDALADIGGVVAITGDIHAFFAGTPSMREAPERRIVEIVAGAVSSSTLKDILVRTAQTDPMLREAGAVALALAAESLLQAPINADLAYASLEQHGYVAVEANGGTLDARCVALGAANVTTDLDEDADTLAARFRETRFQVRQGAADLYKEIDGNWKRWDGATRSWI